MVSVCWFPTGPLSSFPIPTISKNTSDSGRFAKADTLLWPDYPQLFDPLNKITVDAIISPKHIGERDLAAHHFLNLMPNDLVLMDRGYPAWWLFALVLSMNAHFCARISKKWLIVRSFIASGELQRIVHLPVPNSSISTAKEMGLDLKPLTLRLIRIDIGKKPIILIYIPDRYPAILLRDIIRIVPRSVACGRRLQSHQVSHRVGKLFR